MVWRLTPARRARSEAAIPRRFRISWSWLRVRIVVTLHCRATMTRDARLSGRRAILSGALAAAISGCRKRAPAVLTIAAAANLTGVFDQISSAFTKNTGSRVTLSYGSTAQLSQQIAHGAPFDLFAAADAEHIDALIRDGKILPASRAIYARGRLALWVPPTSRAKVEKVEDLAGPTVRVVAIAQPEAAPYGAAAVEALQKLGIWAQVQPKVVYAGNINMAKQFASTGNGDAAFTAYSLVLREQGRVILVEQSLYRPLNQALGIVAGSSRQDEALASSQFLIAGGGGRMLEHSGYAPPRARDDRSAAPDFLSIRT